MYYGSEPTNTICSVRVFFLLCYLYLFFGGYRYYDPYYDPFFYCKLLACLDQPVTTCLVSSCSRLVLPVPVLLLPAVSLLLHEPAHSRQEKQLRGNQS